MPEDILFLNIVVRLNINQQIKWKGIFMWPSSPPEIHSQSDRQEIFFFFLVQWLPGLVKTWQVSHLFILRGHIQAKTSPWLNNADSQHITPLT